MNWKNLQENKCPKCGADLEPMLDRDTIKCSRCIFAIKEKRMEEIVSDMVGRKMKFDYSEERRIRDEERNLEDWNNFGREKVTDDFSDSSSLDD